MLKIYNKNHYISINNGPWKQLSAKSTVMLDESEVCNERIVYNNLSFEECINILKHNHINSIYLTFSETLFLHKRKDIICIHYADDCWSTDYTNFDTISYKVTYTENNQYTLSYIMEHFPADMTIQYLKERGMTTCPILK